METARRKLTLYISIGIGLIVLALKVSSLPISIRGVIFISGGWLMAIGILYQVKLYAEDKDVLYYVMTIFAVLFLIGMLAITLFYVATLLGWA